MKFFYQVISTVFVTIGAIMGAGYITGREPVSFFGVNSFYLPLAFASLLFGGFLCLLYSLGKKYDTLNQLNKSMMKKPSPFNIAVHIACFISVSGLLAGLDSLFYSVTSVKFPLISILVLLVVSFSSKYGIKGVERISLIFIPVVVFAVLFLIFSNMETPVASQKGENNGYIKAMLFSSLNVFINLPPIVETAKGKSRGALILSGAICAVLLFVLTTLILLFIKQKNTFNNDMPLLSALSGKSLYLFSAILFIAMITSVISAYYPLYSYAKDKGEGYGVSLLAVSVFCFSRLGLTKIVEYAYPVIGVFGIVYVTICLIFVVRQNKKGYKTFNVADNKNRLTVREETFYVKKEKE